MKYYRDLFYKLTGRLLKHLGVVGQAHRFLWEEASTPETRGRINMNDMAKLVSDREQGDQVNIAQIKEVLRIFLDELSMYRDEDVLEVVNRYKED